MNTLNYPSLSGKIILLVEDDPNMLDKVTFNLEEQGCKVIGVNNVAAAEELIIKAEKKFDVALVDMYIPESNNSRPDRVMRGEQLAYTIRKRSPNTIIIGMSINLDRKPYTQITDLFSSFIYKKDLPHDKPPILLYETLDGILASPVTKKPKIFIVHGHDGEGLLELKDYIQNTLRLGEPIILRDRASLGKTIIEKFESEARNVDIVFVLMTPDDNSGGETNIRRTRQNVIFEAGFFYSKLQRTTGKVILLKKGELEIPSDISGMIYIDITNGISSASDEIRRELKELGWI